MSKGDLLIIKNRISTANSILSVSKAMEMISASNFRKYRAQEESYVSLMRDVMYAMPNFSIPTSNSPKKLFILIGSDHALCGDYNTNIGKLVNKEMKKLKNKEIISLVAIGRQLQKYLDTKSIQYLDFSISEICGHIFQGEISEIYFVYNKYMGARIEITNDQVYPIPVHTQESHCILELDRQHAVYTYIDFMTKFYTLMADISENYFRMINMRNSSVNAEDLISDLSRKYNKERQQLITKEIIEIIGGLNE